MISVRPRHFLHVLGTLAVMLALVGRLASGSMVADLGGLGDTAALLDAMVQCQPDAALPGHAPDKPVRHGPDQGLVALASFLSQPSPTLAPLLLAPPPRRAILVRAAVPPPVRGPPAFRPGAAWPRGPPFLA